jgi:hypothetical protein
MELTAQSTVCERLVYRSQFDSHNLWESVSIEVHDAENEIDSILSAEASPVVCECCRGNCKNFPSVGWARVCYLDPTDSVPSELGWFRLCEPCYARANAEDDPREFKSYMNGITFSPFMWVLKRVWPTNHVGYANGMF